MRKPVLLVFRLLVLAGLIFGMASTGLAETQTPAVGPPAVGAAAVRAPAYVSGQASLGRAYLVSQPGAAAPWRGDLDAAYNPVRDEYAVVWAREENQNMHRIEGRRVGRTGQPLGAVQDLSARPYPIFQPQIAFDPVSNKYLLVFAKASTEPDRGYEVYGQLLDQDLVSEAPAFKIISWANRTFSHPRLTLDTTRSRFVVTWGALNHADGTPTDVAVAFVPTGGGAPSGPYLITTDGYPTRPDIVYNPIQDELLVVWTFNDTATDNHYIYGTRVDPSSLTPIIPPGHFQISAEAEPEYAPLVEVTGSGSYIVAYQHYAAYPADDDVYAVELDPDGNRTGDPWVAAGSGWSEYGYSLAVWPRSDLMFMVGYSINLSNNPSNAQSWMTFNFNNTRQVAISGKALLLDTFRVSDSSRPSAHSVVVAGKVGGLVIYRVDEAEYPVYARWFDPFRLYLPMLRR